MNKAVIALVIIFFAFTGVSFAQENSPTLTPSPTPNVKYELAYPGMLPDNRLYKLKVLRDKIMIFLTRDPMKKASYHLLLADKRIYMSKLLVDKGEVELAKETALKGENEYTLLVNLFKDVQQKPNKELEEHLEKASLKHQEILNGIVKKVENKDKKTFEEVVGFSKLNLSELKKIYKYY